MTAFSSKIEKFAMQQSKRKNTYDDDISRQIMKVEFQRKFPSLRVEEMDEKDYCDLVAYNSNDEIECFFELDHTNSSKLYWPWYSILERKIDTMSEMNLIAPVVMVWITKELNEYRALNLRSLDWKSFPVQPIPYKAKENIENLVHPDDFHIRVPFKAVKNNPVFTVGKDIGVERFMKGTK